MLLTTNEISPGILECRLNLNLLYADADDRAEFERRWTNFYLSDETHPSVYSRAESDTLTYFSESLVPTTVDDRPPLLLLLGNPASHSVSSGMFFAFEGKHAEHRFWVVLRKAGLLDFGDAPDGGSVTPVDCNQNRKRMILELDYVSPYRIGMTVFYTLPSAGSGYPWSGVGGIRKLLGARALDQVAEAEQQRIAQIIHAFMPRGGGVLAFQRDAYEAVRSSADPRYALTSAMAGALNGTYRHNPAVCVMGLPPTRHMYSARMRASLARYAALPRQ